MSSFSFANLVDLKNGQSGSERGAKTKSQME